MKNKVAKKIYLHKGNKKYGKGMDVLYIKVV